MILAYGYSPSYLSKTSTQFVPPNPKLLFSAMSRRASLHRPVSEVRRADDPTAQQARGHHAPLLAPRLQGAVRHRLLGDRHRLDGPVGDQTIAVGDGRDPKRVQRAVDRLSIDTRAARQDRRLSGGNQQKVVVAREFDQNPKLLIAAQPTRGIDVGSKNEIYGLMRGLADNGVAVMMISSDMEEVIGVSDRMAVMHEGTITGLLSRDEFSEHNVLSLAIGKAKAS